MTFLQGNKPCLFSLDRHIDEVVMAYGSYHGYGEKATTAARLTFFSISIDIQK